jgi:hypothetical protein
VLTVGGVGQTGADISGFEFRKVVKDFGFARPFGKKAKDVVNCDSKTANCRLAAALAGLDRDSIHPPRPTLCLIFILQAPITIRSMIHTAQGIPQSWSRNPRRRRLISLALRLYDDLDVPAQRDDEPKQALD